MVIISGSLLQEQRPECLISVSAQIGQIKNSDRPIALIKNNHDCSLIFEEEEVVRIPTELMQSDKSSTVFKEIVADLYCFIATIFLAKEKNISHISKVFNEIVCNIFFEHCTYVIHSNI